MNPPPKKPAWVPAPLHITGFFEPVYHRSWRRTGSRGAGLAIGPGVETTVRPARQTRIFLDGRPSRAPTTRRVVELLAPGPVEVRSRISAPVGAGLGTSGSGALSTAAAIDRAFGLRLAPGEVLAAAHRAEVENRTGLGTVFGISGGGLTIRTGAGLASLPALRVVPVRARIAWVFLGPLSTRAILSEPSTVRVIRREGRASLRALLRRPTLRRFFTESRRFALATGLPDGRILDALEAVEAAGGVASMAMLGRTLFAPSTPAVRRALAEFGRVREGRVVPGLYRSLRPFGKQRS